MSHCAVGVPLPSLVIANIMPAHNVSLHGRFFVVLGSLCLVLSEDDTHGSSWIASSISLRLRDGKEDLASLDSSLDDKSQGSCLDEG